MPLDEGVIKFTLVHQKQALYLNKGIRQQLQSLNFWREKMVELDIIGCDLSRYGACYGNVSMRYFIPGSIDYNLEKAPGHRAFLISGTQTGNIKNLMDKHFARVYRYDWLKNKVWSEGPIEPSSESMTHGTIYDLPLDLQINCVFHVHSPQLWSKTAELEIPMTAANVSYGTPEMALEMKRLLHDSDLVKKKIVSMGGHQDGLLVFGSSAEGASSLLFDYLSRAARY